MLDAATAPSAVDRSRAGTSIATPAYHDGLVVVSGYYEGTKAFPGDEIVTDSNHRRDASTVMSWFSFAKEFAAIAGIAHVKTSFEQGDAWVFHTARIGCVKRLQDRASQTVPMDSIRTDRVTNAADPVRALSTIVHMKEPIVMDDGGIEHVIGLPVGGGIGEQDRVLRVAL